MVILSGCSESNRRLMASGVVRTLPSSSISPLSVSSRHRWLYLSPRSSPAVVFAAPLLPLSTGRSPPSIELYGARRYLQTLQHRVLRRGSAFSSSSKVELEEDFSEVHIQDSWISTLSGRG